MQTVNDILLDIDDLARSCTSKKPYETEWDAKFAADEFKTAYWAEKDPLKTYFELQRQDLLNFTIVDCRIDDKTLTRKLYFVGKNGKYRNLGFELSLDLLSDMSEKFGIDPVQELFSVMNYEGERE